MKTCNLHILYYYVAGRLAIYSTILNDPLLYIAKYGLMCRVLTSTDQYTHTNNY